MYLQQQDNSHGWIVLHLLCAKVFLALPGAVWTAANGGGADGGTGQGALGVGETLQILTFFNIRSKDFHILHSEGGQYVDQKYVVKKIICSGQWPIIVQKKTQDS